MSDTEAGDRVPAVLEDPSGNRARWLRRGGRAVFLVFLAWLVATVLGGLGLIPVGGIPFAHVLRPSAGPPPIVKQLPTRQPSAADLLPALPAVAQKAAVVPARTSRGKSKLAPGRTRTATTRGKSAAAPGRTRTATTHGKSATAPGRTRTTRGRKP